MRGDAELCHAARSGSHGRRGSDGTWSRVHQARWKKTRPRKQDPLARGPGNAIHGAQREGKGGPETVPEQPRKKALESKMQFCFFSKALRGKKNRSIS